MESEQAPANKSNNDASRRAAELVGGCDRLSARIANFQGRKPHVEGIIKLQRAVQREREVALLLQSSPDPARGLQGLENNLRGFSLELECADWAPDVTAVRKRFASRTPSIHAKLEDGEVVEVDVVAQGGLLWIECKAERGRVATGLVQQALEGGALPKSRFALWAEALGLTGSDGGPLAPVRPRHCEDLSDRAWASAQWDMLQAPALAPRVLLFPDSAKRIRRWPKAQFVEIAARLKADGWAVAAMGAKRASLVGIGCRFWFGYPVDQVASMIAQADLVITNDTGPAHLAGTLGTPTLALCGPTDGRVVFSHMPEVTPLTAIGSAAPPCAPCHFSEPIGYGARCREEGCLALMALTPDDVLDAARQRLAETLHLPPGQPARAVA